ncbi:hypothetical protein [Cohnella rhizosphaerae]|uniref:Uncharacterized protein n=1 Tax=Cohnella rhizosphaerae TaxID=1457232 RepID=A0A9X4KTC8_9BACL|nr:hypothetical protein [Cohnella rhizosphaerae]MDG0808449.1 hypothetical protein [Cohnella rhizosphaerae]
MVNRSKTITNKLGGIALEKYTIKTNTSVLIGYIVEPNLATPHPLINAMTNGIWIRREKHITFLAKSEIIEMRPTLPTDKESDHI